MLGKYLKIPSLLVINFLSPTNIQTCDVLYRNPSRYPHPRPFNPIENNENRKDNSMIASY